MCEPLCHLLPYSARTLSSGCVHTLLPEVASVLCLEKGKLVVSSEVCTSGLRINANPIAGSRGQAAPALQLKSSEPTGLPVLSGKTDAALLL